MNKFYWQLKFTEKFTNVTIEMKFTNVTIVSILRFINIIIAPIFDQLKYSDYKINFLKISKKMFSPNFGKKMSQITITSENNFFNYKIRRNIKILS